MQDVYPSMEVHGYVTHPLKPSFGLEKGSSSARVKLARKTLLQEIKGLEASHIA